MTVPTSTGISVVFPVHQKADTLLLVLQALAAQDFREPTELLFVLDRCTDASEAVIAGYRPGPGQSVKVLQLPPGQTGAAQARNFAAKEARGDVLCFLDPDILIPVDYFTKAAQRARREPRRVFLGPVLANNASSDTWPMIADDDQALTMLPAGELLRWANHQPRFADCRLALAQESGSLDHLEAPWTIGWSGTMVMQRELFWSVGGFESKLDYKGSEDLELSYRLHCVGATFAIMLDAACMHLPHPRNRQNQEHTDQLHERKMLARRPTPEVEALCAFDGSNANPMLQRLRAIDLLRLTTLRAMARPSEDHQLHLAPSDLVIGPAPEWLLAATAPKYQASVDLAPGADHLQLHGFSLPFDDGALSSAVLYGTWQLMPERLACRLFDEATRVAQRVTILKNATPAMTAPEWKDDLPLFDVPYWERSRRIRRSFFDFNVLLSGRAQSLTAMHLTRQE